MFSLIIAIISIALIAAITVATVNHGGDALTEGTRDSFVSGTANQGQQLEAAVALHKAKKGYAPANVAALVTDKYLKDGADVVASELSANAWVLQGGYPTLILDKTSALALDVCVAINASNASVACVDHADAATAVTRLTNATKTAADDIPYTDAATAPANEVVVVYGKKASNL